MLKKRFTEGLLKRDPDFAAIKPDSRYVSPADVVFSKLGRPDGVVLFVILVIDDNREAFAVEVGWSTIGRFPELPCRPSGGPAQDSSEFTLSEFVCRLGDLSPDSPREWLIQPDVSVETDFLRFVKSATEPVPAEQAATLVTPQVDNAIEQLDEVGFAYLNEYLRSLSV